MNIKNNMVHSRYITRIICVTIALSFCFLLFGCNDYKKYIENKERYEQEVKLVELLVEYGNFIPVALPLALKHPNTEIRFEIDGETVFTHKDILSCTYNVQMITISFDALALHEITSFNIGKYLNFLSIENNTNTNFLSYEINQTISNGKLNFYAEYFDAKSIELLLCKGAENNSNSIVNKYNEMKDEHHFKTNYLPDKLPSIPQHLDVSSYLKKAEKIGFTVA